MALATTQLVPTYGGRLVPVPPLVDPAVFARFAARVLVLDGACHFWMGPLHGNTDYGEFSYRISPRGRRVTDAHRYAYAAFADLPEKVHVRHRCDEPLCTPVTRAIAATHLTRGDAVDNALDREFRGRGGRRRHGVRRPGATVMHRHERAQRLQAALRTGTQLGLSDTALLAAVDEADRASDPYQDQLELLRLPPRRVLARERLASLPPSADPPVVITSYRLDRRPSAEQLELLAAPGD